MVIAQPLPEDSDEDKSSSSSEDEEEDEEEESQKKLVQKQRFGFGKLKLFIHRQNYLYMHKTVCKRKRFLHTSVHSEGGVCWGKMRFFFFIQDYFYQRVSKSLILYI